MLYMLGQIIFDIQKDFSPKYLIKVGVSRNVNQRLNAYKTDNPSALLISTTAGVNSQERKCHSFLADNGKCYQGEWYEVNFDFFSKCITEGFAFFPKGNKKQNVYLHISKDKLDGFKQLSNFPGTEQNAQKSRNKIVQNDYCFFSWTMV